jgi:hypothetical protein
MSTPIPSVRLYEPGRDITAVATATVTAKRLVKISGDRAAGGNLSVAHADAGGRAFGVAKESADSGQLLGVARGGVVKVLAGGNINAFAEVQIASGGTVVTKSSGTAIGYAVTGASTDADAQIALY